MKIIPALVWKRLAIVAELHMYELYNMFILKNYGNDPSVEATQFLYRFPVKLVDD